MSEKAMAVQTAPETTALKVVEPKMLFERMNQLHQEIERRAFELFKNDGGIFGHDLDHWFKAEMELLHPIHIQISESGNAVDLEGEVPGFEAKDLEVSIESGRVAISGKKESTEERKKGKTVYKEQCSNQILRVVDLPASVDATKGTATLKNGILNMTLPKNGQAKSTKVEVKMA